MATEDERHTRQIVEENFPWIFALSFKNWFGTFLMLELLCHQFDLNNNCPFLFNSFIDIFLFKNRHFFIVNLIKNVCLKPYVNILICGVCFFVSLFLSVLLFSKTLRCNILLFIGQSLIPSFLSYMTVNMQPLVLWVPSYCSMPAMTPEREFSRKPLCSRFLGSPLALSPQMKSIPLSSFQNL